MSEIITAMLAVAIAAQVAVMAKAGKDFLNSSLNTNIYGKARGGNTQEAKQTDNNYDSGGLESETKVSYTYDDKNYQDYGDDENKEDNFEANIGVESSLRLPL